MNRPMRVFQRLQTASAMIKGLEVMGVTRRSHCILRAPGGTAETRLVNQLFGLDA
jgi:hypothetical protein